MQNYIEGIFISNKLPLRVPLKSLLFVLFSILHSPSSLKRSFTVKKSISLLCVRWTKKLWVSFVVKQIIDCRFFSCSFILSWIFIKKCLKNRNNRENLDSSLFLFKNWTNKTKRTFKNYSIFYFCTSKLLISERNVWYHINTCKKNLRLHKK